VPISRGLLLDCLVRVHNAWRKWVRPNWIWAWWIIWFLPQCEWEHNRKNHGHDTQNYQTYLNILLSLCVFIGIPFSCGCHWKQLLLIRSQCTIDSLIIVTYFLDRRIIRHIVVVSHFYLEYDKLGFTL
jgi:hypothetical protein